MTLLRFTSIFGACGVVVPILFRVAWVLSERTGGLGVQVGLERLMLVLWPTSLMMFPAAPESALELKLFLLSIGVNAVLYAVVGALIWFGLRRHMIFAVIAGVGLIALWWWLLTL